MDKKVNKRINVLHLSTYIERGGNAVYRLHKNLKTSELINSKIITVQKSFEDSDIIEANKGFYLTYFLSRVERKYFSIITSKKNEQGFTFYTRYNYCLLD